MFHKLLFALSRNRSPISLHHFSPALEVSHKMVVHNPNNWHWVDKNCLPWSKDYLNEKIVNTKAETESYTFVVCSVDSVDGHCNVTQRKGKVLCIYDMKLLFSMEGLKKDLNDRVSATVTLDEFVHDQDDDEYVFSVTSAHADDIKKSLAPVLRAKLQKFQQDLIAAHERDMQHATGH